MGNRILLVEEEIGIRLVLEDRLRVVGYDVETAENGIAAVERAFEGGLDLIILGLILPGKDGFEVCAELRRDGISTPVLMLTARTRLEDKLRGFANGADDYLTKPFDLPELLARAKALLRRSGKANAGEAPRTYHFDGLTLDASKSSVYVDGERLVLSMKQYELLHFFVRHPGEPLSRARLLREVWSYDRNTRSRTLDVHVSLLRKKIKDNPRNPRRIRTVPGIGYQFAEM